MKSKIAILLMPFIHSLYKENLMKVYKKIVVIFSIFILFSFSIYGQSRESQTELGTGDMVIDFWSGIVGPDGDAWDYLVEQFVKDNPGIRIKMQKMPWPTPYFDKLAAALVAGGGPDVLILWQNIIPEFAIPGHLMPVADLMFQNGMLDKNDFSSVFLESVKVNGKYYSIPVDQVLAGTYVNVKLLDKAGIPRDAPPRNQREFLDYARRLTWDKNGKNPGDPGFDKDNIDVYGTQINWARIAVQPAFHQWEGGGVISSGPNPKVLINSPGSKQALQFFVDLIHKHHVAPPVAGWDGNVAIKNGKVAMSPDGAWQFNFYRENKLVDRVVTWPYPRVGPLRGSTIIISHTIAVTSKVDGEKLEAVMKFIKYMSDKSAHITENAGMPPARLSLRDERLKAKVFQLESMDNQLEIEGIPEYTSDRFNEIDNAWQTEANAALAGEKSVDEALDAAAKRIERILR